LKARTGVRRSGLYGNDEGDDGHTSIVKDRFTMNIIVPEIRVADLRTAHDKPARTSGAELVHNAGAQSLNVETVASNPLLPANRKWAIRFNAGGIITIVLGMRVYALGSFTPYFAGLVSARLGIPLRRVRVYYSATLPAALHTPIPSPVAFRRNDIGPVARAVADVIEGMCDEVIEKGRLAFAAMAGLGAGDVGFDQASGRLFVLDRNRSGTILETFETARGELAALARKPQVANYYSFAE